MRQLREEGNELDNSFSIYCGRMIEERGCHYDIIILCYTDNLKYAEHVHLLTEVSRRRLDFCRFVYF
jgi:hypothetical protein